MGSNYALSIPNFVVRPTEISVAGIGVDRMHPLFECRAGLRMRRRGASKRCLAMQAGTNKCESINVDRNWISRPLASTNDIKTSCTHVIFSNITSHYIEIASLFYFIIQEILPAGFLVVPKNPPHGCFFSQRSRQTPSLQTPATLSYPGILAANPLACHVTSIRA